MSATTMSPPLSPGTSERVPLRSMLRQAGAIARRYLLQIKGDPEQLMDVVLMPIIFLVMFVYIFGGAISGSTDTYLQFITPAVLVQTAMMAGSTTGVGINSDISTGVMDRFRSLPIARSSVLTGRLLADMVRLLLCAAITLGFAALLGFRIHTDPLSVLAAVALVMGFGFALGWLFLIVGIRGRSTQQVQGLSMMVVMPLQFGSNMFAAPETMPDWLRAFVKVNPMSHVTSTCRGLLDGGPVLAHLWPALAWIAGITAVAAPVAISLYRKRI
jgi:oleandomycin transport system permease protein